MAAIKKVIENSNGYSLLADVIGMVSIVLILIVGLYIPVLF